MEWFAEDSPQPPPSNFEVARSYLRALSGDAEPAAIAPFFPPDAVGEEFSNRALPSGALWDLDGILRAWSNSREVWDGQSFELLGAAGGGSQVAMEIRWTARSVRSTEPFEAGQTVRANLALFLRFRDRRIVRQRSYVCFEFPDLQPTPDSGPSDRAPTDPPGGSSSPSPQSGLRPSNFEMARAYFAALSEGASGQAMGRFFARDALQETPFGRLGPARVASGIDAIQRLRDENRAGLVSERYELLGATGGGSKVALELRWAGLARAGRSSDESGRELQSRQAVFLKFREGLIVRQRTYECA